MEDRTGIDRARRLETKADREPKTKEETDGRQGYREGRIGYVRRKTTRGDE
jgi:hypothetical protein